MTSNGKLDSAEPTEAPLVTKKRRLRGACDICRRQKIRCDSAKMEGNRCSNCVSFNSECTHTMSQSKAAQKASQPKTSPPKAQRGPRRKRTTAQPGDTPEADPVETVRNVVDGLLQRTYIAPQDREALLELLLEISRYARNLEQELDTYRQSHSPSSTDRTAVSVSPKSDFHDAPHEDAGLVVDIQKLPEHLKRVTMDAANNRFFGKNSSIMFVKAAMEARSGRFTDVSARPLTRPMYWTPLPWEVHPDPVVKYTFPPADLLRDLVDIYFKEVNIFTFILHRPTFEKSIADGLHLRNPEFGAVVLAACALASKHSPDKRVLLPSEQGELSAGWEWFRQIRRPFSGRVIKTASLYELQLCCLCLAFQQTGSDLESTWLLCGVGILYAQDIGAHRINSSSTTASVEDEQLKRCCFYLSISDSTSSACFGRPRVSISGDCDLSRPLACDDEYWEHPDPQMAFTQPPGKPPLVAFFNAYISLVKIFTFEWRTSGPPQDYTGTRLLEPDTVAELDARFDQWASQIPEHLLWNPYQENDVFFEQSVALYSVYYHLQILVHRPFLQAKSASTMRSVAICTTAARSCATIADVKCRRGGMPSYQCMKGVCDSAIVLLLNISGGSRSGLPIDIDREMVDVYKCMRLLRQAEHRYQNAGRFYDCIAEILNVSNLPLPPDASAPEPLPMKTSYDTSAERDSWVPGGQTAESWPESFLSLPMAVDDLGSMPIYGSLDTLDNPIASSVFEPLPSFDVPIVTQLGDDMDTDYYLSRWIPYFSTVDGMAQAMQGVNPSGI
ncbi:Fungal-trans domain-containing protein [Mycena sanguinolenta]|uniref:Fungal-trans domain-containing protein n=1 Tax=Mycena sanguinolenta TaxID=230812 RepID=A0A8H6YT47_9AGAR|nr:Fungal-trans domain-containing protein [Mycena sanguinolenta]